MADKQLSPRQALFATKYAECLNATQAAIDAGYSEKTARSQGSRLLTNADIMAVVEQKMASNVMGKNEVLARLSEIGRSDVDEVMSIQGSLPFIDMDKAKQAVKTGLIKKIKVTKSAIEFELHDKMRALELLGKHHALFTDVVQHDWRKEAQAAGVDDARLFEEMVNAARQTIAASAGTHVGGGVGGGEETGEQ